MINLVAMRLDERPAFFQALFPHLQGLRARCGRPHWIVVDEAHHLMSSGWEPAAATLPQEFTGMLLITVHPRFLAAPALAAVDILVAVGKAPGETLREFCGAQGIPAPPAAPTPGDSGQVLVWDRRAKGEPFLLEPAPSRGERRRHRRKYAEGDLGPDLSFYFRRPDGRLNLRAQNLFLFLQIASGVDDDTWMHHLRRRDYSRWFRSANKDENLIAEAERIEKLPSISPAESRELFRAAIERDYTLPVAGPA